MNVVMTERQELVEVQGSGEKSGFSRQQLNSMLDMAEQGLQHIFQLQRQALVEHGIQWASASGIHRL